MLLLVLSIAGMIAIVPLSTWAATGRLDRAWQALREYGLVMGLICLPVLMAVAVAVSVIPLLY